MDDQNYYQQFSYRFLRPEGVSQEEWVRSFEDYQRNHRLRRRITRHVERLVDRRKESMNMLWEKMNA